MRLKGLTNHVKLLKPGGEREGFCGQSCALYHSEFVNIVQSCGETAASVLVGLSAYCWAVLLP